MRIVQSLDRGLEILEILAESSDSTSVTRIGELLDVDRSTAYRLLSTLQGRGYVSQGDDRKYHLGKQVIRLGMRALNKETILERARPYLVELANATGETAHFAQLVDNRIVYLDRYSGSSPVQVSTPLGSEAAAHATATGKVLSAFLPPEEVKSLLEDHSLVKYTPRTITNVDSLQRQFQEIKAVGYAVDDEERYMGVRCIAGPVYNHERTVIASIGISGPAHRVTLARQDELSSEVVRTAAMLSEAIGFEFADDPHESAMMEV